MSTFRGVTREFKRISIDRFDGTNLESTLYILSHFHSDHIIGLTSEPFRQRVLSNPQIKIYCSEITRNVIRLEDAYNFLNNALVPLVENVPSQLCIPNLKENDISSAMPGNEEETVTLTLLPAGHCPGSVMCLIEGAQKRILYTGDYRVAGESLKLLWSIFDEDGQRKHLDSLYVDTTFFHPRNNFIPSQSYSLLCATEVISHWISQGKSRVVNLKFKASLGYEHMLSAISRHFNMKIHMSEFKFKRCQKILDVDDLFTTDPNSTQIHACDIIEPSKDLKRQKRQPSKTSCSSSCSVLRETQDGDIRTLIFSAMFFAHGTTPDRYCMPVNKNDFRICYSLHPSYSEVCQLVEMLKPDRAFANVTKLGNWVPGKYDVQQELDKVVEQALCSSLDNISNKWDQMEKKLKRQFSEVNFFFDETQSYLKKNSKRLRLEDHDLSTDILGMDECNTMGNVDASEDGAEHSLKRKRNSIEELSVDEETNEMEGLSMQRSKRIALERQVLQEHIQKCESNNGCMKDTQQGLTFCLTSDESDTMLEKLDVSGESKHCHSKTSNSVCEIKSPEASDSNLVNKSCRRCCDNVSNVQEVLPIEEHCNATNQIGDSFVFIMQPRGSQRKMIDTVKEQCNEMINLCNDDDPSDIESKNGAHSDVLVDSDVTVELSSSFDTVEGINSKHFTNSSTPVFLSGNSSPRVNKILPPISEEGFDGKIQNKLASSDQLCTVLSPVFEDIEARQRENGTTSDQRVVCIDLTDELDEEEEDDVEEGQSNASSMRIARLCRGSGKLSEEDEYDDEGGYEGGDECDSPEWFGGRRDAAHEDNQVAENEIESSALTKVECQEDDDSNDRTSGYDSDIPHFTELQRKSHARFEKLYKRKQRKIKIKTRRQNLRNVAKDDVIIIDDDDDTSETDDSYDYDSDFSSSDYNHYPGRGRVKNQGTADDSEQFLVPSMSSSSESSQTLSSEDDDNVVVVVNCTKSAEGEEEEDGEERDAENGEEGQSLNENIKTLN